MFSGIVLILDQIQTGKDELCGDYVISSENYLNALENLGRMLLSVIINFDSLLFSTFLLLFFLFFAMFLALLSRVPPFSSDGKTNRSGKMVAGTLSFGVCLSFFFLYRSGTIQQQVEYVMNMFGIFAITIIAVLFFALIFFGFRRKEEGKWQMVLIGCGIGVAVAGYYLTMPFVHGIGWLVGIVAIVLYISSTGIWSEAVKDGMKDEKKK